MELIQTSNKELLGKFLDVLWGTGDRPRRVCLAYKPNPSAFEIPPLQNWPRSRNAVIEFILTVSARRQTIYINPAMLNPNAISNTKEDILASWVLWVDFDGNAVEAMVKLEALSDLPRPSYRLSSGLSGHEHWYWVLEAPAGPQSFEPVNRKLAYFLNGDIGCWNSNRVMRPPYTVNYMDAPKYEGKKHSPEPVDFIEANENKYSLDQFDVLPPTERAIEASVADLGNIPQIGDVLAKYIWDEKHFDIFKNPPTQKGGRSGALARLAHFGAENGMSDSEIYAIISDVDNRCGKFTGRKDRDRRLSEFIVNARVKHPYGKDVNINYSKENIKLVYTFNELLRSEFKVDWLVDKLIVARTINLITSAPGAGKSRFSMQLAKAMATGTQFLKWPISKPMKVMYLSLEMGGDLLKHFATQLSGELSEEESDRLMLVPVGQPVNIANPEGFNFIKMLVAEHKPEVLFIDAMGKLTIDELSETVSKAIANQLLSLTIDFGTTIFMVHHNRKEDNTGKKRPSLADVYGNTYITTDATLVLMLYVPEDQSHVELIFGKSRAYPSDDYLILNGKKGFNFQIKERMDDREPTPAPRFYN